MRISYYAHLSVLHFPLYIILHVDNIVDRQQQQQQQGGE